MVEVEAHHIASTDGVTAVAHDYGGTGPNVVMCHATGFCARYWDPIAELLVDRFRCVAIDLRGHGDSVLPEGVSLAWQGMAQDMLAVIDALDLGSDLLGVGHSMGGATIIRGELTRPGTVAKAWLFEPILPPPDGFPGSGKGHESPLVASALKRREVFASRDEAFDRYASRPPFSLCDPAALRAYVNGGFRDLPDGTVMLKCRGAVEADVFRNSLHDGFERLPEVQTQTWVAASGDADGPAMLAPMAVERMPNASLVEYPDLTHFGPMQEPARIAADIASALA